MPGNKILLIHQGAIGDLVLSLPAFYAIRTKFPAAHIEIMGYPHILSLIFKRFYSDEIVSVDRAGVAVLYNENGRINKELQNYFRQFEQAFIFGGKSQALVIQNIQNIKKGPDVYFIKTFPENADRHVTDFQLQQLAMHGFENVSRVPEIFLCADDNDRARHFLQQQKVDITKPLIAVHPGSGSKTKNWPLHNFVSLVKDVYYESGGTFLAVQGPAEQNTTSELRAALAGIPLIDLQCLDLPLLAAVIYRCGLFVGNDSGITHLAAAAGVPTIAVFGPTDPGVWGPRGRNVYIARDSAETNIGWKWVCTDAVLKAALAFLNKTDPN
jgi:heptosyltransferase-2